jgi:hypothetical protein
MRRLPSVLVVAILLAVRPAAQQQHPSITATVTLVQQVDVFQTASQAYTLSHTPAAGTVPEVFVNGILMCGPCGNDYTIAGTTLTFTGQQTAAMETPVIQAWYWSNN